MSAERRQTKLPHLREVALNAFSLYRVKPTVTIDIDRDVFCLAGANGLGKSSFIAALNYGLTGGVAPPNVRVEQLSRYQRDASAYGTKYFAGRITELDRPSASVALRFSVGDFEYYVRRRFFAAYELEEFSVVDGAGRTVVAHDPHVDAEERRRLYETRLVQDTGLQTFAQFVFLQHFVFSFDEHRHLLFWDTRATELVLYLALGLDPSLAKQVDELRKAAAAAGSQARNAQYQATLARNELERVTGQLRRKSGVDESVMDRYRSLQSDRERITVERNALRTELADSRLEFAEASATRMRKQLEYDEAFMRRLGRTSTGPQLHAIIGQSLSDHQCRICGTQHAAGPVAIEAAIALNKCPLCTADLVRDPSDDEEAQERLVALDQELAAVSRRSKGLAKTIERLDGEVREKQRELASIINEVSEMQAHHELPSEEEPADADEGLLRDRISQLEGSIDVLLGRKEEHLQLRAEALVSYEPIQAQLKSAWNEAEVEFVPRFRRLAEEFMGLPLQVTLDAGSGISGMAHLALSVDGTHRRRSEQLSESQRFFLDIALRMSLAQHMTSGSGPACLLIDTPEGALDIAYEAKAGDMFASFTAEGDQVIMTANVNTSQLLTRMAERSGRAKMQFVRMTEWTTLTDVQIEEEHLFEKAYGAIEEALDNGSSKPLAALND